ERHIDGLRAFADWRDLAADVSVGEALLRHELTDDAFDAAQHAVVEKTVRPQLDTAILQLLFDLAAFNGLGAFVTDHLDPLPLLHAVGHDLSPGPLGERVV